MRYNLSALQLSQCLLVAERRNCAKLANGITNNKIDDKQDDFGINLAGVMSEYVVAKYLGTCLDYSLSAGGDGGVVDLKVNDATIQVKSTTRESADLYVRERESIKADFYVSCSFPAPNAVEIAGYASREMFLKRGAVRKLITPVWFLCETELRPIKELKNKLKN